MDIVPRFVASKVSNVVQMHSVEWMEFMDVVVKRFRFGQFKFHLQFCSRLFEYKWADVCIV